MAKSFICLTKFEGNFNEELEAETVHPAHEMERARRRIKELERAHEADHVGGGIRDSCRDVAAREEELGTEDRRGGSPDVQLGLLQS